MGQFPIKGVKWFQDIISDASRQYGVEVHKHLPQKTISVPSPTIGTSIVRLPEQQKIIEELEEYCVKSPQTQVLPDTYAATIENGTIIGNSGMIVTPDGYLIAETASMTGFGDGRCYTIEHLKNPGFNPPNKGHLKGNLLSVANPNLGYFHHLFESFFSLLWFDGFDVDQIHVSEGYNYDRMKEFIIDLGISPDLLFRCNKTDICSADTVSFFAPCSWLQTRQETMQMMHKVLIEPRIKSNALPNKKVYFKTGMKTVGSKLRKIVNIDLLESYLKELNYEFVDPASMTLTQKIDYLQNVDTVLSTYGSSVANLVLSSNPKLKHINIAPPHAIVPGNILGHNNAVSGYTNTPILPVYPKQCFNNEGYLLKTGQVSWSLLSEIHPLKGQFFSSLPKQYVGGQSSEIDINKFKRFYEHYLKSI